jgi:hypothetical protein
MKRILNAAAVVTLLSAPAGAWAQALPGDTIVVQWNEVTVQNIIAAKPAPTTGARELAIVATCMYDAWSAFDPVAVPTQPGNGVAKQTGAAVTDANKQLAMSYAAYRAEADLFPTLVGTGTPAAVEAALAGVDPSNLSTDTTTPAGIGNLAAAAVIAYRHNDGANQLGNLPVGNPTGVPYADYTGYVPVNSPTSIVNPNAWQPLLVPAAGGGFTTQKYSTPFFGLVQPFGDLPTFTGNGPNLYPGLGYTFDADTVLFYSATLNDTTKTIAEYWADFPGSQLPAGHWSRIGEFISRRDHHGTDADAKMFFAETNAVMDAGIASWAVKRQYNNVRPITSIHYLYTGKKVYAWAGPGLGNQWIDGGTWLPYQPSNVITPAFPGYISGHSTFSAAAATVLANFTGSDALGLSVSYPPGSSVVEPGITPQNTVTLYFPTLSYAAKQAGLSRRYGGIHTIEDDLNGRATGRAVGWADWQMALRYFSGGSGNAGNGSGNSNSWFGPWGNTWWWGGRSWGGDN